MTESKEVSTGGGGVLASLKGAGSLATEKAKQSVTAVADYLPYIKLCGASTNEAKEGKVPVGHFALILGKDNLVDLGPEFPCGLVSWRPKASVYKPEVRVCYDEEHPDFNKIADDPDGNHGPEFLIWLPEQKRWACLHLNNPTGRRESPNFIAVVEDGSSDGTCKIASRLIDNGKYKWHGPQVKAHDLDIVQPEMDEATQKTVKLFNEPVTVSTGPKIAEESSRE